jgi:hypothetical protein
MPQVVKVPALVGSKQSEAEAALQGAGLKLGAVTRVPNAQAAAGNVVSTSPAAGESVDASSEVKLEVSSGPAKRTVPDLVGSKQSQAEATLQGAGLKLGAVTRVPSTQVAAGNVVSTSPPGGESVDPGSEVKLEVSSGPPPQVKVPAVVGLTQKAAEAELKNAGLEIAVNKDYSDTFPVGGISGTNPEAGAPVSKGSTVELQVSKGPESHWTRYLPTILFGVLVGVLALIVLAVILGVVLDPNQKFLTKLAVGEVARGLITFLIAIGTVGIAIILAVSTLVLGGGDADKRFDRAKQVLTVLIGVLGTIVGFYFGSPNPTGQVKTSAITTTALPGGEVNKPYPATNIEAAGLTSPLNWSVKPALPAGLNLDTKTGTISGTPTVALSKTTFTFTVTDSALPAASPSRELTLEIK